MSALPSQTMRALVRHFGRAGLGLVLFLISGGADWAFDPTDQEGARFGSSIAVIGDVDNDGFPEVAAGAFQFDGEFKDEGRVYVFSRKAFFPPGSPSFQAPLILEDPNNREDQQFGVTVAGGDFNCDGLADVVVGARYADDGTSESSHVGAAYQYLGSLLGLETVPSWVGFPPRDAVDANYGASLSAGDFNNDGCADLAVGATGISNEKTQEGRVFVYLGSPTGLLLVPTALIDPVDKAYAWFGDVVVSVKDVNGDNFDDLAVTAAGLDNVYLFLGFPSGLQGVPVWTGSVVASLGSMIAAASDLNKDGFDDMIIGAAWWADSGGGGPADEGRALIYYGAPVVGSLVPTWAVDPTNQVGAQFGAQVAAIGDMNGDSWIDVGVGAWMWDNEATDEGRADVFFGSPGGIAPTAALTLEPTDQASANFGQALVGTDFNNDGLSDVIVTAYNWDGEAVDEGRVEIFLGSQKMGKLAGQLACSDDSQCLSGVCTEGGMCCDACGPCTSCSASGACLPDPDGTTCTDLDPCTIGDSCMSGVCVGATQEGCFPVKGTAGIGERLPYESDRGADFHPRRRSWASHLVSPKVLVPIAAVIVAAAWLVIKKRRRLK